MSNIQQRVITIYIHPDRGPILPMQLDLMAVEMTALKFPDPTQRDEIRIKEIARLITAKFKGVQPEGDRAELASLAGRLSLYTRFNGIVLRLPGEIKEGQNSADKNVGTSEAVNKKLEQIDKQVEQLTKDLRKEQREHQAAKDQLAILKNNYRNVRALYDKVNTQFADAQLREQQVRQDATRWRQTAERVNADIDIARQEAGMLQMQLEYAQQEIQALTTSLQEQQQAWVDKEEELSCLRQEARSAESAIKNLEETVRKREQDIKQLRRQLEDDDQSQSANQSGATRWKNL